ncbi:ABC-F family ATP-binding cassette domain-containing protein [Bifidobacterium pullorum]|uniref:ABC-F family ATP-binding cassette domain-containing protein n=1 Tax=Bifidobacterium pullorum TaxID=78448 RepID=UPI000529A160|nr:ABC-F family ATP-binding cassette domain-containing protein [Bifidobacterium pullorum]
MPIYDIGLEQVSLAFATKTIFTDVTQGVFEGDRIGIVGRNGDGKSTLLHLFNGTQEPDAGRVTKRGGLSFGMLDQRDPLDDNATVRQAALEGREDYEWASETRSREIVEALLGGISLDARIGSLSGGQRRRADLARLLLKDWDILALDEPTNHLDVVTIHWLAEHLKTRWGKGQGALLLVTHDRWFLDEVCESMWEVHDGTIDPFEGGYSAYMLQRVERDRQADVREARRRNLARKELAWLSRGARARSTKQKFHVKQARELIADVPPLRNTLELKQMATSRLGKQVVDLIDVTQVFAAENGVTVDGTPRPDAVRPVYVPDDDAVDANGAGGDVAASARSAGALAAIDPDVSEMAASVSRVDVVRPMYAEPQAYGAVELAVDDLSADPRLRDAGVAFAPTAVPDPSAAEPDTSKAAGERSSAHSAPSGAGTAAQDADGETTLPATSAAHRVSVTGRKVLDDVTWLIGPGDRFGIVGANGAGKSTLLKILDGSITPTAGHVNIGKTVRFAVLSQRLDELEALGKYKVKEVLSRYKPSYIVDGKEVTPGQLMERLGFEAAQLMTPIRDLSGGQKRRMQLLLILLDEPNVLIMDEPGNDLDTDMLAVMEDLLDTWPGTLIVVSHDRYLLERVTDQQFALIGGKIRHLPGGVDDYLAMTEAIKAGRDPFGGDAAPVRKKGAAPAAGDTTGIVADAAASEDGTPSENDGVAGAATVATTPKLTGKAFHEASKRVSQIERKLAKLEEEKSELEAAMAAHDPSDYAGLNEMNVRLQAIAEETEPLEAEWMELSEQLE